MTGLFNALDKPVGASRLPQEAARAPIIDYTEYQLKYQNPHLSNPSASIP
jgi:hypothetical protein